MTAYLIAAVAGYAVGSVPFAHLVVRRRSGLDLHAAGSENVGANNAFRVTGSRGVGVLVLLLDALKGGGAVLLGWWLALEFRMDDQFHGDRVVWVMGAVALLSAVAGHNYNAVLSLRAGRLVGGKGLATGAGGFALLAPGALLAWLAFFGVGLALSVRAWGRREIIAGNVVATAVAPLGAALFHGAPAALAAGAFALLVLPKHTRQARALLAQVDPVPSAQPGKKS